MTYRTESDSMGKIDVAEEKYWGAQTQRALGHFAIGTRLFPPRFIHTYGLIKLAAARVNRQLELLDAAKAELIEQAAREVMNGQLDDQFPLAIFISGSGTQFNMNVNEVIAGRANEISGGKRGGKTPIHPNDDVNKAQSTNDSFPTAMNVAAALALRDQLTPPLKRLRDELHRHAQAHQTTVKLGRTHLQDAVPMTLGQEISGWVAQLDHGMNKIDMALAHLSEIPIGGTAVGNGLNAPKGYAPAMARAISELANFDFREAPNKFEGLAANDALAFASGALRTIAGSLMKIANDVRWLASGPRCGLGELRIPENEPGSSIMPGKVNPTQPEAVTQVAVRVYGNDAAIAFAASQGNFELNVYKPVMMDAFMDSCQILADVCESFRVHCVEDMTANTKRMEELMRNSLALVTALNPHIGYDKAAEIAHKAYHEELTLKDAAHKLGYVKPEDFDQWVDPKKMIG
ncbi:MAG: class II fumarate hydratase [Deltaproteobacteria bacterium]|nr:class II fumarate hydratase [Deltaproteobacteria bacterium]